MIYDDLSLVKNQSLESLKIFWLNLRELLEQVSISCIILTRTKITFLSTINILKYAPTRLQDVLKNTTLFIVLVYTTRI